MFAITVPNEKSELAVSGFIVAFIRPHRHRHKPRLLVCGMTNDLPFELFIAFRYLLARRKQAFISLISFISVLGVMVCSLVFRPVCLVGQTGVDEETHR